MSTTYTQIQKILASDGFGNAVALSTYGDVALVGALQGAGVISNTGCAYVLRFSDHQWISEQKLIASDSPPADQFGKAVALSHDGQTALVGRNGFSDQGRVHIFVKSSVDSAWILQGILSDSPGVAGHYFGNSVALSADGNTAVIGSVFGNSVSFFIRNGTTWTRQQKISDLAEPDSGVISADGNTALIGLLGDGAGGTARVFTRSAGIWTQKGSAFISTDIVAGDRFGNSVALLADGLTALVGAPNKNGNQGAAYAFTYSGGAWSQQYKFLPSDVVASDQFGSSVALGKSPEGHVVALIGATGGNKSYIFRRVSDVWTHFQTIRANDSDVSVNFGNAVALAGHGLIGLVGASAFSSNQGSAYFFGAEPSFTPTADSKTSFISFLPQVLIGTIALYTGIVSMFLHNAKDE